MDLIKLSFSFLFSVLLIGPACAFPLEEKTGEEKKQLSLYAADNEKNCLICHGKLVYTITDTVSGVTMISSTTRYTGVSTVLIAMLKDSRVFRIPWKPDLKADGIAWTAMVMTRTMHSTSLKR
jgi:hypothetical protein